MDAERRYYSIGEMCDAFGVTARALRFYEDEELIAPERRGTTRLYTDRDRARLTWILRGKRVGFSLTDIRELLDLYDLGDQQQTQMLATRRAAAASGSPRSIARSTTSTPRIAELDEFVGLLDERLDQKES